MHICMLLVSRWLYAKFACYRYCIEMTLIASPFFAFLLPLILFFYLCRHISCVCDLEYSCIRLELWLTCLSTWTKHVLFITAKLSSKHSLLCSTRCRYFSVNHEVYSKTKMKLKLTLIYYSAVDIYYLILFIYVSCLCNDFVIISLKMFYSANPFVSLSIWVKFGSFDHQCICRDNRFPRIIKHHCK